MRSTILAVVLAAASAFAATQQVSYDPVYDNKTQSLATVECSDGSHGLLTKGYTTFGSLPDPYIGGAQVIAGYNSASCGTCWALTYKNTTINVIALDYTKTGFNIGLNALNKLTNGSAVHLGVVQASVKQLNASACGL